MTERLAYSIAEAAEAVGISQDTNYRLIQRGELHPVLVGKRRIIPRASLLELQGIVTEGPKQWAAEKSSGDSSLAAPANTSLSYRQT